MRHISELEIYLAGFGVRPKENGGILYVGRSKIKYSWLYGFETYLNGINGPCSGDSGGAAFNNRGELVGILSRSTRDERSHCGGFAIYIHRHLCI
ncbi:MAG: trypsin-like serine protease [bacterium]|nr:trypsin-like serine protease [bacterium]